MKDDSFLLKQFITASLNDICEAIAEARQSHGIIAPQDMTVAAKETEIEFDIAVTISNSASTTKSGMAEGKIEGGFIKVVKAGVDISSSAEKTAEKIDSNVSRIKFKVPVFFRYNSQKADKKKPISFDRDVYSDGF